jgi:periplasmic protein TonB
MLSPIWHGNTSAGSLARNGAQFRSGCDESMPAVMNFKKVVTLFLALGLGFLSALANEAVEPPVPVRTVAPIFPEELRRMGTSGIVTVSILIDEKGNVTEPKVIKTSNEAFSQPAVDALTRWKFKPAKQAGEAVAMRVNIPIQFTNKS